MAQWLSWLERRPVTAEVTSSSLVWVVCNIAIPWDLSSAGRASALQAEGHRFEPYCSHHENLSPVYAGLFVMYSLFEVKLLFKMPERIALIESMIPTGSICADIGTDHGYLPMSLAISKKCKKIIATDISETCLKKAIKNITLQDLTDVDIEYRIGDGIKPLCKEDNITHVVIAGMGGRQIIEMLRLLPEFLQNTIFILQPMQNIIELRNALRELHCTIINEDLVYENGRYFEIITLHKNSHLLSTCSYPVDNQLCAIFGPCIIAKQHPLLLARANEILETYIQTAFLIEKAAVFSESSKKIDSFRENIEMIRGLIYELQHSNNKPVG